MADGTLERWNKKVLKKKVFFLKRRTFFTAFLREAAKKGPMAIKLEEGLNGLAISGGIFFFAASLMLFKVCVFWGEIAKSNLSCLVEWG